MNAQGNELGGNTYHAPDSGNSLPARPLDSGHTTTTDASATDTVTHGLYATVDQIVARMKSVGLLKHAEVSEAVEFVRSGNINTVPMTAEQFAREVFYVVTGSRAFADEITRRLINNPGETLFPFGDDGIVISTIGSGSFGDVHLVHLYGKQGNNGAHAVKVSKARMADDEERFQREIAIMSRQGNGNGNGNGNGHGNGSGGNHVLPAYAECGTCTLPDNGHGMATRQYYAMEYLRGHTLQEVLKEVERTGIPIHPRVAMDLLVALLIKARNFRGHAHRDIKPDNIMVLDEDGKLRLVDCGLSVGAPEEHRVTASHVGGMGSPLYMAPEQFEEASRADKINDLYGIAATVYHLATGKPPVAGERMQIYVNHKSGQCPDFSIAGVQGQQGVSLNDTAPDLSKALGALLSKERSGRVLGEHSEHPDDAEIREIFNEWINHLGVHSSFDEQDLAHGDPGLFAGEALPDSVDTPGGDVIGSRLTCTQIHALLSTGSVQVLEEGVVKAERGKKWKILKIGTILVLVVGVTIAAIVGGISKLTSSKSDDTAIKKGGDGKGNDPPVVDDETPDAGPAVATAKSPVEFEWDMDGDNGRKTDVGGLQLRIGDTVHTFDQDQIFRGYDNDGGLRTITFEVPGQTSDHPGTLCFGYVAFGGEIMIYGPSGEVYCLDPEGTVLKVWHPNEMKTQEFYEWAYPRFIEKGFPMTQFSEIPENMRDQTQGNLLQHLRMKVMKNYNMLGKAIIALQSKN